MKTLLALALAALVGCGAAPPGDPAPNESGSSGTSSRGTTSGTIGSTGADATSSTSGSGSGSSSGTSGAYASSGTWSDTAAPFFANNCAHCHGAQFSSYANVQARAADIQADIRSGKMPKSSALSGSDRATILGWFECGMPQ